MLKPIFRSICQITIDALFPLHPAEQWLLSMDAESIISSLPRAKSSSIPEGCAIFSYKNERVYRLVWSIKYKKSDTAASIAASALKSMLGGFAIALASTATPTLIVIPMPISKQRRRERGFNQCELIADKLTTSFPVIKNLLRRKHHTSRQTLKNRKDRQESASGLFEVDARSIEALRQTDLSRQDPKDAVFIIIEDVITTGSTMKEAVETMRAAGFANTWGLAVAH